MDDLEAVLASLEQTEAALRPPATRARDLQAELDALPPLAPPSPSEQHHLSTSLAAELDAELDAVFAKPQSESLLPGGPVHDLGTKCDDFVQDANGLIADIRQFKTRVETCHLQVMSVDADSEIDNDKKKSKQDIDNEYKTVYNRAEAIFKAFGKLTAKQKQYHNVASVKDTLQTAMFGLDDTYDKLKKDFKWKLEQTEGTQKQAGGTARNGTATEDFSEITRAADDEGQYDHEATQALYKKTLVELDALKDKTSRAEEIVKTIDDFFASEDAKDTFRSNNRTEKADDFYEYLTVILFQMTLQKVRTSKQMVSWREYVKNHVPSDSPDYALLPTWNALEKQYVDFELELEERINSQRDQLYKICTVEYIAKLANTEAQYGVRLRRTHANGPRAPSAFPPELTDFAQKLIALVYPPTRVPPWSASAKATRTAPPRTHNTDVHNKHLAALCARVAHIAGVAIFSPALAALRFAVELAPASPLLAGARQKQPAVLVSRETATPHPNHKQILDLLAASNLARLLRLAQTELQQHAHSKHASPHAHTFRHEHTHKHESEHSHPKHSTQQRSQHEDRNHEHRNHNKHRETRPQEKSKQASMGHDWLKKIIPNSSSDKVHGTGEASSGAAHANNRSLLHRLHDAVENLASPRTHPPSTSV